MNEPKSVLLIGDVFRRVGELPDASVDLVFSSPPFLALRSYLPDDDPNKGLEIGRELTPAAFLDTLLSLSAVLRDKLAPHGSLVFELGDTYSGSGGAGGDYRVGKMRGGQPRFRQGTPRWDGQPGIRNTTSDPTTMRNNGGTGWPLGKSLCGIPTLYAWSLAYGRNLLTGEPSPAGQWRIRNLVHWVRPNPPVGALGDKYRPATSYLVVACTSRDRWFDLDAVRTPHARDYSKENPANSGKREFDRTGVITGHERTNLANPAGAPPLDWWKLSARGYKGSHYAVFPPELAERPILSMCPPRVCLRCGEPSSRLTEVRYEPHGDPARHNAEPKASADYEGQQRTENAQGMTHGRATKVVETVGWSDCGHDEWRNGLVLDPFAGTCTTLQVANVHGRDAIGIDIDSRNAGLGYERLERAGLELIIDYGMTPEQLLWAAA